jgi:hypothetical protein
MRVRSAQLYRGFGGDHWRTVSRRGKALAGGRACSCLQSADSPGRWRSCDEALSRVGLSEGCPVASAACATTTCTTTMISRHPTFGQWVSTFSANAPLTLFTAKQPMPATSAFSPAGSALPGNRTPACSAPSAAPVDRAAQRQHALDQAANRAAQDDGQRRARLVQRRRLDRTTLFTYRRGAEAPFQGLPLGCTAAATRSATGGELRTAPSWCREVIPVLA